MEFIQQMNHIVHGLSISHTIGLTKTTNIFKITSLSVKNR